MISQVYLDTSALVKRYIDEPGSRDVARLIEHSECHATSVVTEAELPAALARAVRMGMIARRGGEAALRAWMRDRDELLWIQLQQPTLRHAGVLAWESGVRGYDAVHLSAALWWKANLPKELLVATYDRELWHAARQQGLDVFPQREP